MQIRGGGHMERAREDLQLRGGAGTWGEPVKTRRYEGVGTWSGHVKTFRYEGVGTWEGHVRTRRYVGAGPWGRAYEAGHQDQRPLPASRPARPAVPRSLVAPCGPAGLPLSHSTVPAPPTRGPTLCAWTQAAGTDVGSQAAAARAPGPR